jgi:hypothetical protein
MKKIFSVIILVLLLMVSTVGCGGGVEDDVLLGKYSGPAGSLEFLPDGHIKVDFNTDHSWLASGSPGRNHTTHTYNFITKKRKIVTYDKGEYLSFQENGKKTSFIMHPCQASKDKIILHPESINEAVFNKVAE